MKITLISSICSDLGLYTIAPLLKKEGHDVSLLFIPELLRDCQKPLSEKETHAINNFVAKSDVIGINGLSENFYKTATLLDNIKRFTKAPIVYGVAFTLRWNPRNA